MSLHRPRRSSIILVSALLIVSTSVGALANYGLHRYDDYYETIIATTTADGCVKLHARMPFSSLPSRTPTEAEWKRYIKTHEEAVFKEEPYLCLGGSPAGL